MKLPFIARILLIDCGKASKRTRGNNIGAFSEGGSPPFNVRLH
jgi:hypothetical protein